jgi:hypothetical protein
MAQHGKWNSNVSTTKMISGGRPDERERQVFDVDGRLLMSFTDMYDTAWHVASMSAYTYNAAGLIASHEKMVASGVLGTPLKPHMKDEYNYTPSGQVERMTTYSWDINLQRHEPIHRNVYTYSSGRLISDIYESYNVGVWYQAKMITYSYPTPNMVEVTYQDRNFATTSWENRDKQERMLDGNGNTIMMVNYQYYMGAWALSSYQYSIYDVNNNLLSQETLWFNSTTQQLEPIQYLSYTYNDENNVVSYARKMGYNNVYSNTDSIHYYYGYPTAVTEPNNTTNALQVYPIPASNSLHINMAATGSYHVYLYDATGKLAKAVSATGLCTINVQDLSAGNYVLQVQAGGSISSKKVMIAR